MKSARHVFWITGLSGSGKTTLGSALTEKLDNIVHIDGDIFRSKCGGDLDYSVDSRIKQIIRLREQVCKLYSEGQKVIVSALYSNEELLNTNRRVFRNYTEIYLHTQIDKLCERDSKGLYSKFLKGEIKDVVGMDIEWIEPKNPDFIFDNTVFQSCDMMVSTILKTILIKGR